MPMEIDPALVSLFGALDLTPPADLAVERAQGIAAAKRFEGQLTTPVPDTVTVSEIIIPGDVPIPARLYVPAGSSEPRAGLVFAHGGGWATGSPEVAHTHCGGIAAGADAVVISIDYRLVPENPFPAGLDDTVRAIRWVADHAAELGVDPTRLAIGGESAGANLVAAAALVLRDAGGPEIALQLLEVPVLDVGRPPTDSRLEIHERFPALAVGDLVVAERYPGPGVDPTDPRVSPLLASDLSGLPPTLILAADVDPVRDDAVLYGERLADAGVPVRVRVFPGIVHGTEAFTLILPSAREWLAECVAAVRTMSV